jgi:hypothetical protein
MNHFQQRDKFFYAHPKYFPNWDYPSRLAIGMNLQDFYWKDDDTFKFEIKGIRYQIAKSKAKILGNKYKMPVGLMPYLIPKEEFEVVGQEAPETEEEKYKRFSKEVLS